MKDDTISRAAAIDAMMKLQAEDIEAYGASIPEGFDGDRAATALKALPSAQPVNIAKLQPNCNQVASDCASDCISRQAAIEAMRKAKDKSEAHRMLLQLPPAQPGCEDAVPRKSVEYICKKNTVSTNPYEHKYHDKFIQFMNDLEISDFGRWQHSNGFNTALVAVKCDLDKVPSVTPKAEQPGWIPCSTEMPPTGKNVLVTLVDGAVTDGTRWKPQEGKWFLFSDGVNGLDEDVLAWMPLPAPYCPEGDDKHEG